MLKRKVQKKCIAVIAIILIAIFIYGCVCKQEFSNAIIQNSKISKTNIEYNDEEQDGNVTNPVVGDINLDGSVDIADVIVLNKYLLGMKTFSDEQRALADCYSDGVINSTDSLTLLKYVLEMVKKLPADEAYMKRAELFKNKNADDFYKDFIANRDTYLKFNEMATLIHKTIRQSAIDNPDTMKYTGDTVSLDSIYSEGNFGNNISSYGYVGLCLYEYAVQKEDDAMLEYVMETQGEIYNVTSEKAKELGWQKIRYTSEDLLQVGDIIASPNGAQIFLGDGVYSCDSDEMIREINLMPPAEPTDDNYIIRIEPKSGSDDNMEWFIEDNTLNFSMKGEAVGEDIPWKASLDDIVNYKVYTVTTYAASAAGKVSNSILYSQRGGVRYVSFGYDIDSESGTEGSDVIAFARVMKKIMKDNPGYDIETVEDHNIDKYSKIHTIKLTWNGNLDDEFYKTFIERNVNAVAKHMKFYEISQIVKEQIAESRNETGNVPQYDKSRGIYVPREIYSKGKIGEYIDCSSFVSMCLYEYGIHTGNENIIDFIKHYRVDSGGSIIREEDGESGVGGQVTAGKYYELDDEILDKIGLEMLPYNTDSDLRAGDILVKSDHIEIYAENGQVFNCGDNMWLPYVKTQKTIKSRADSPAEQAKILRFK